MMQTEIDVSTEDDRLYHYDGGKTFAVPTPQTLFVITDDKGVTHRVVSKDGRTYRPERGWTGISWKPRDGAPAFVA